MDGEEGKELDKFKYLGVISVNGGMRKEVTHTLKEGEGYVG